MILRVSAVFGFLTLILPFVTASHWSRRHQHHQELALRSRGDVDIHKRQYYSNARFTWYDLSVGLGSCGSQGHNTDFTVALNVDQYQQYGSQYPNPVCWSSITLQYGGVTAQAAITDECMGCPWGGLDLSPSLFAYLAGPAGTQAGVLTGSWWFDTTTPAWTPTSTSTWDPPSTTSTPVYTPPPPTTSSTPDYTPPPTPSSTIVYTPPPATSTTSTTSKTSSSSTSSATSSSAGLSSGLATPSGGVVPPSNTDNPEILFVINRIMIDAGVLLFEAVKQE